VLLILQLLNSCNSYIPVSMNQKRILVYGDSNSWGFVPCGPDEATTRYDTSTRWPAVMACHLGDSVDLLEEALSGRTTDLDDFEIDLPSVHLKGATLNGTKLLPAILSSHLPLDLVIIMLGTNDLKTRFNRSPQQIATAVVGLARLVEECKGGVNTVYPSPKVLLLAPPPLGTGFHNPEEWAGGPEKSQVLGSVLKEAAAAAGLPFLDAGEFISTEGIDGVHLTSEAQRKLGGAVAEKVRVVLGKT
jgi:lysophospholipase L1-like esterase